MAALIRETAAPGQKGGYSCHLTFPFLPFLITSAAKALRFSAEQLTSNKGLEHWAEQEALSSSEITTEQCLLQLLCNPTHLLLKPSRIFCFLFFAETCCHSPRVFNTGGGGVGRCSYLICTSYQGKINQLAFLSADLGYPNVLCFGVLFLLLL